MSDDLSELGQIAEKSNLPRTDTILHSVLKFHFDHACFQGEKQSRVFGEKVE